MFFTYRHHTEGTFTLDVSDWDEHKRVAVARSLAEDPGVVSLNVHYSEEPHRDTDLVIEEFAIAAGVSHEEAGSKLAGLPYEYIEQMVSMANDLTESNKVNGMAPSAASAAAHRRIGREMGRQYNFYSKRSNG